MRLTPMQKRIRRLVCRIYGHEPLPAQFVYADVDPGEGLYVSPGAPTPRPSHFTYHCKRCQRVESVPVKPL